MSSRRMARAPSCFQQTAAEVSLRRIFALSPLGVLHTARAPPHRKRVTPSLQMHPPHLWHRSTRRTSGPRRTGRTPWKRLR